MPKTRKTTKKAAKKTPATKTNEGKVVFAFRLSPAEREAIHKAAGSRGASQFVLAAAKAAARGDRQAFDELVAQAKTNQ